jgi:hypothetical protein
MDNVQQTVKNLINWLINSNNSNIQWQIITGITKNNSLSATDIPHINNFYINNNTVSHQIHH